MNLPSINQIVSIYGGHRACITSFQLKFVGCTTNIIQPSKIKAPLKVYIDFFMPIRLSDSSIRSKSQFSFLLLFILFGRQFGFLSANLMSNLELLYCRCQRECCYPSLMRFVTPKCALARVHTRVRAE